MWGVLLALVFCLAITRDQSRVHRVLMIVVVRQGSVDLRRLQVRVLLDDLCGTVAMDHVISHDVDYPMACPIKAQYTTCIDRKVWICHGIMHPFLAYTVQP
jgi:hypothetical protein